MIDENILGQKIESRTEGWDDAVFEAVVYQKLSEDFLRKYKDKLDYHWFFISKFQKMSEEFMD